MRTEIHEQLLLLSLFLLTIDSLFPWPPRGDAFLPLLLSFSEDLPTGVEGGGGGCCLLGASCVEQAREALSAESPAEPVPALCLPLCLGLGCLLQ